MTPYALDQAVADRLPEVAPDEEFDAIDPGHEHQIEVDGLAGPAPVAPDTTAQGVLPKEFKDKDDRENLAMRIGQAIAAADSQKAELPRRWRRNEAFCQNRILSPRRLPYPGAMFFHIPLMGPRIAQRKATFVQTILGPATWFRVRRLGKAEPEKKIEDTLMFVLRSGNFERFINRFAESMMITNAGLCRTTFQIHEDGWEFATHTGRFALPVCEAVSADDFSIFPANDVGIGQARWVGHAFDLMQSQVDARMRSGEWLDEDVIGGDMTLQERKQRHDDDRGRVLQNVSQPAPDMEDENVTLYEGVWHSDEDGDGQEEMYRVIVATNPDAILRIERMNTTAKGYHRSKAKHEDGAFWTESSPAQDLQPLQIALNTLMNQTMWAVEYASRPAVMVEGDVAAARGYKPGEYRFVKNLKQAVPIPATFRGDYFPPIIQMVTQFADSAGRTSDTITGAPSTPRDATATEQNIKLQGFQTGVSDDISEATPGLISIVRDVLRLLVEHWEDWYPLYRDCVPVQDKSELEGAFTIELGGRSPADSPQVQSQETQQLMEMTAQLGQTIPNSQMLQLGLFKMFIEQSSLSNKHDVLRQVEELEAQLQATMAQAQALQGAAQGLPPGGAAPPALPAQAGVDPQSMAAFMQMIQANGGVGVAS